MNSRYRCRICSLLQIEWTWLRSYSETENREKSLSPHNFKLAPWVEWA